MVCFTQEKHLQHQLRDVLQETDGNHYAEQLPGWKAIKLSRFSFPWHDSTKATWPLLQSSFLSSDLRSPKSRLDTVEQIGHRRATTTPSTQKKDTKA